ncbi:MAG: DUF3137 domain-containing protein [Pirellulaceae bacterium]|nr:DUF3137 domain-containing protein [Pirellulaceae bacterium]
MKRDDDLLQSTEKTFIDSTKSVTLTRGQTIIACVVGFILGGIAWFPIGFLIGPPLCYFALKFSIQRSKEMKNWAQRNGWVKSNLSQADSIMESFQAGLGSSHLWSRDPAYSGDLYHRGDGDSRVVLCSIVKQNTDEGEGDDDYLVAHHPNKCPDITIMSSKSASLVSKIPWPSNRHKVEFESTEFNKSWIVMSTDPKSAYDYLDQSTIDYLNQITMDCAIEFTGDIVVIRYDSNSIDNTVGLEKCIRWFEELTKAVPDDLLPAMSLLPNSSSS